MQPILMSFVVQEGARRIAQQASAVAERQDPLSLRIAETLRRTAGAIERSAERILIAEWIGARRCDVATHAMLTRVRAEFWRRKRGRAGQAE